MNRLGATLGLVIAIAVVIAIILGTRSPSASGDHGNRSSSSGSTTVQRRDLVQTDTESGTLSYADPRTVYDGLSGTITWLPAVGQVIKPGQALYRVGGVPVILMNGTTPAYRDLNSSDSNGPDILELNRNLVALGFNPDGIVVDDVWQSATTAGVELFQESLGESQTGDLKLGNIVFLPHDRVISAVDASLGSNGSGGSANGNGNGSATAGRPNTGPEFVSLTTAGAPAGTPPPPASGAPHKKKKKKKKPTTVAALLGLLKAQSAQLQAQSAELRAAQAGAHGANNANNGSNNKGGGSNNNGGAGGGGGSGGGGGGGGNGGGGNGGGGGNAGSGGSAVLQTSSTQLVVNVDLDATKQSEAKVGEPVTVEMPGGNTVNGKVTAVSPIAQSASNSGNGSSGNGNGNGNGSGNGNGNNGSSGATIPVTVALSGRTSGAGLDQAAVSVSFAEAKANNVLSVPVTALLAVAGGNYDVQEAAAPHTLIPVNTGLFAAGYVEISGQGIHPGLAVTDSQG